MQKWFFLLVTLLGIVAFSVVIAFGLSTEERLATDRKAILSMAGNWKVSYRFNELYPLHPGYTLHPPYDIKGYEKVIVIEEKPKHISLQHLLVDSSHRVIKHWRQDWDYEREAFWVYTGSNSWKTVNLNPQEVKDCWTQTVWSVDDSPRYAGYGHWNHTESYSEWISNKLVRPLPRRELSRRSDYNVMESVMHQIVFQGGWLIQEDNEKWIKGPSNNYALVKELGIISYRSENKLDFSAALSYMKKTEKFWSSVRTVWEQILGKYQEIKYKGKGEGKKLAEELFAEAEKLGSTHKTDEQLHDLITKIIESHFILVPKGKEQNASSFGQ
ncbi:hypothetical protein A946_03880 [Methylacidiphilum kamchatkense Kam1]|uniref:Uncharacterized protein n=1 Tax=Methylacidiphilum kamchatkense Kam1 TaxID=1202785 RepID=A0A0C1UTQ5_9BACT|nr:DUF6607 family protein [Methylacidiphilum kamchatkense]KIE59153.1 hypothetical protein A946_03880 [Methylacidiphilum kamchatkense Kam1]QDQ42920.1 hypothetical protein kam1_1705 [Methylacidiphilum kamchatkense Kam1]